MRPDLQIDRIFSGSGNGLNTIGDGVFTYKHSEVPSLLLAMDGFLQTRNIGPSTCLAVECHNSVPAALLLLALLKNGNSFVLQPPSEITGQSKPTPNFCEYRVTVSRAAGASMPTEPERCLSVEPNADYNGRPAGQNKLYLRTSGSMGASKIVVHGREALIGNAWNCVERYGFGPESRVTIPVPIAHMYGFAAEFLPAILVGASIDLQEKTNLLLYLDREKRFQPTIAFVTPTICVMLLKGYKKPREHYRAMVTSGQRIGEDQFRALNDYVGGRLVNQYGSTEMGAIAACDPGDELNRKATTVGEPMAGVQLRVEAPGSELSCRHQFGFEGYVGEDGEWLERRTRESWYRTGDLAAKQADGSLTVLGRADASVNRSGYLVLLEDIERRMEQLDGVGQIAVVTDKNEGKQGLRISAFCVPSAGAALDGAQLRQRCFQVLPPYAIPDEVRVVDRLPALASGKVDRQTLAALAGAGNVR